MAGQISRFNRLMLVLLVVLYLICLGAFTYANWMVEPEHNLPLILINALILSIPLALFFGSIYVLARAGYEHRTSGTVSPGLAKMFFWAPRLASILIIFFISLFSLDVLEMDGTPLELAGAFIIHNLPSIFMIVMLVIAWRRPVVGFIAFLIAGGFFLRFVIFGGGLGHFLLFSGPLLAIAALFFADWRWHPRQLPPAANQAAA